jgi:hypothetical protein
LSGANGNYGRLLEIGNVRAGLKPVPLLKTSRKDMNRFALALLLGIAFTAVTHGQVQQKDVPYEKLLRADLEKLQGGWEMKVDSKSGWKGTIYAYFIIAAAGGPRDGFGFVIYDVFLTRGKEELRVANVPGGGIGFAGVKRGEVVSLVTDPDHRRPPFDVNPQAEVMAPFSIADNKVKLDFSKSRTNFIYAAKYEPFNKTMNDLDLDWSKLEWTRTDRKRSGK